MLTSTSLGCQKGVQRESGSRAAVKPASGLPVQWPPCNSPGRYAGHTQPYFIASTSKFWWLLRIVVKILNLYWIACWVRLTSVSLQSAKRQESTCLLPSLNRWTAFSHASYFFSRCNACQSMAIVRSISAWQHSWQGLLFKHVIVIYPAFILDTQVKGQIRCWVAPSTCPGCTI